MSIYVTTISIDSVDHADGCTRLKLIAGFENTYEDDPDQPCSCNAGPLIYEASHILPTPDGKRGGCFDLAAIPGFISMPGRPAIGTLDDDRPYWPWLRVGVKVAARASWSAVVLTRLQVAEVYAELGEWLAATGEKED